MIPPILSLLLLLLASAGSSSSDGGAAAVVPPPPQPLSAAAQSLPQPVSASAAATQLGPQPAAVSAADSLAAQPQPVSAAHSLRPPLRAVGQLSNGCTGFLVGPCHVVTVAHCVYEPWRKIWFSGLDFHPARNLPATTAGQQSQFSSSSPLGWASKADVRLHPNWTASSAASASDAAIIITSTPIGRTAGWFRHRAPASGVNSSSSTGSVTHLVAAQQLSLHIAGFPDNKPNGSMWHQCCTALDWEFQGNLLWHDCYARGGNSGSPIFVLWPSESTQGPAANAAPSWDQFQAVGVHSSSLKFPRESQVGVYAEALYADSIAKARARDAQQAAGQCTATTSSLSSAPAAGVASGRRRRRRALLAGAGGREADGENTLLPVAVPFTADTAKWIEAVLKEFAVCPGE